MCDRDIKKQQMRVIATNQSAENVEKCKEWLENCKLTESEMLENSDLESVSSCTTTDCSSELSEYSQIVSTTDRITTRTSDNSMLSLDSDQLQTIAGRNQSVYENIFINNSKKVHLGNVTVINGPIYLKESRKKENVRNEEKNELPEHLNVAYAKIRWIDRRAWLSQPPTEEYEKLKNPAKYVIICHSATEDATNHADNILIVRYIQQFHIECRKWSDIAYNFLIGCDGYTYKGRGWDVVGAHSFRYNSFSVGICFVGTFCNKLPPAIALEQAKSLISYGVTHGHIDKDYKLIGNCQMSSSKSPGEALFEEVKKWDNYDESVSLENPSELIYATETTMETTEN